MSISDLYDITFSVQSTTATPDSYGTQTEGWSNVAGLSEVKGHMRRLSANEIIQNEKRGYNSTHRFYCNYTSSITAGMRIVYSGSNYKIVAPPDNPHEQNEFLQIDTLKSQ
jgi:SPP1 family predicted phage head-tail adaptor